MQTLFPSDLVIELKKGRESDKVVGQILRYMGWVRDNLCREGEDVKGLIIYKDVDERLAYALGMVQDIVQVKRYSVNFQLSDD
jgi:restriction system protein